MAQVNAEKSALETALSSMTAPAELADAGRRMKALDEELHSIEERWLQLTEELDNIG